jgi:predicted kinase
MNMGHERVIVSNTFTTEEQMQPYLDLAKEYKYRVVSLIIENRHSGKSIHDVPEETLIQMESKLRNSIKLR